MGPPPLREPGPARGEETKAAFNLPLESGTGAGKSRGSSSPRKGVWVTALAFAGMVIAVFIVIRSPPPQVLDLSRAMARSSSSIPPAKPERAFDGKHRDTAGPDEYRWSTGFTFGAINEWIAVDLGKDTRLSSVTLDWELAYAKDFVIRTRTEAEGFVADPARWKLRGKVAGFQERSFAEVNNEAHIEDVIFDFKGGEVRVAEWMKADQTGIEKSPVTARHVMVQITALGRNNYQVVSLYEIQIAGWPR